MQSYRRKCRKFRFVNSAPAEQGTRTALAGSPLTGGEFSAEPQRGVALCGARESAAPAAGAKRKGHLRFPFLFELLPFPCLLARRRLPTCDRSEIGYGRGFFLPCLSQPVRSVRYRSATQAVKFPQARHSSAAQLVSLEITDSTCEDKLCRTSKFEGAGRYNALKNCAALLCRALRRVNHMCSRTVSDTVNR